MKNLKNKKGFSLVELLVVITIMAILSVVAYVAVGGQTVKAKNSRRMQDLTAIQSALEIFYADNGKYPEDLDLGATDTGSTKDLVPKYMPKMALDPVMNKKYTYQTGSNYTKYQVAATIENDDGVYEAYVIGNSGTDIITSGFKFTISTTGPGSWRGCTTVISGEDCVPYKIEK